MKLGKGLYIYIYTRVFFSDFSIAVHLSCFISHISKTKFHMGLIHPAFKWLWVRPALSYRQHAAMAASGWSFAERDLKS